MPPLNAPVIKRYYPALSSVVTLDDFPESLGFLKQGIQSLFNKIHYKDLQYKKSQKGDAAFYSLNIVSNKLAIELFGSGIRLVLNPDESGTNPDFNISAFPVTVEYQWKILAYLRSFDLNDFSFSPQDFFELGLIILNISEEQAMAQFINTFTVPIDDLTSPLKQFTNDLKQHSDLQELDFTITDNTKLSEVAQAINQHTNKYATLYAFGAYLLTNDLNDTKEKLAVFFKKFISGDIESYIKDIITPKAKATLTVSAAVEFPRNILFPYKQNGTIWEREDEASTVLSRFYFGKILLYADTQEGVGYNLDLVGNLAPTYSEIGNTGLLIQLEKLKIDISDKINIPEADADGRPVDFRGVYADALSVTLPAKWFKTGTNTNGSTFRIGGYHLLIGTGGVSGKFALEAVPTQNASDGQITDFFSTKFAFTFPIIGLINDATTKKEKSITINNQTELLAYINALSNKNLYSFKYPIKITPSGQTEKEFSSQQEFRNYITDIAIQENGTMWFNIGSEANGFLIGFKKFDITFKQNKITESNIKGALEIKKFVYPGTNNPVHIDINGHLSDNGDFNLTASAEPPYPIELKDVFIYNLKSVELGKEDDKFYIGTSGKIQFQGFLKDTMGLGPIEIERLRIYSDGSIDLKGGSVNLIKPLVLALGPVEITVTAIHFGSHQKEVDGVMRKFNYFGFDGGLSVDPLGIEIRGDGVKFYYCVDDLLNKPSAYVHIQTIYLDLTIPSSSPVAIINGWISIPEPGTSKEYAGGIKIQLPQAKIAGKADMKLMPKYPAFIIDAEIEFPAPIPLGTVAIYGFRGLLGYRYVAEKEAIGLVSGVNSWFDYYKAPPRGIHVKKFNGPDRTKLTGTPFSIGAGVSLGTSFDNGTVLNIKAMLLLSIPSLFMIDGRAAIISARLGLEDSGDPPFFAFIAVGDDTLEFGFGADFKMPTKSGDILTINAEVGAGFFFKNQRPWYINVGTKDKPVEARILTLISLKSYVMLSASGIAAGAKGEFNFERSYGIIKVHAWAYVEIGGKVSFEKPQFSAFLKAGVGADIDVKFISLYLAVDIMFGVEAPKPFKIYGAFHFSIEIKIAWVFKFKYNGDLEVVWEFNNEIDKAPLNPLLSSSNATPLKDLVKGVSMLSNETFSLAYFDIEPTILDNRILDHILPLDTYIDIKTEKGLLVTAVSSKIGGGTSTASRYTDLIPPDATVQGKTMRQVTHEYSIESISIKSWNGTAWQEYNPYRALHPNDASLDSYYLGQFQIADGQYNTIRLLGTTPFSYTEQGQPGWYTPEQYGINSATLFCESEKRSLKCASFLDKPFLDKPLVQTYDCSNPNHLLFANEVAFQILDASQTAFATITDEANVFNFAKSLSFENQNEMQILLPKPSVQIGLKLSNFSNGAKIKYYSTYISELSSEVQYRNPNSIAINTNEPYEVILSKIDLNLKVAYDHPEWLAVSKIVIEPIYDIEVQNEILQLTEQIELIKNNNNLISLGLIEGDLQDIKDLENKLRELKCGNKHNAKSFVNRYRKEDSLNYYYSREFAENKETFIYAVGTTQENGLISKIDTKGNIVWEKEYFWGDKKIEFHKIIQLRIKLSHNGSFQYVIYAKSEKGNYLLSIDSASGDTIWYKYLYWKDLDIKFDFIESKTDAGFYITISDRNQIDTYPNPSIYYFDNNGNNKSGNILFSLNKNVIINAIDNNEKSIVVAGRYIETDSVGAIIGLNKDLEITHSIKIANTYTTIHDVKIVDYSTYLIAGYDNDFDGIFVSLINSQGSNLAYCFPNTKNCDSVIQLNRDGFYLLIHSDLNGIFYKLDWNFKVIWTKQLVFEKTLNGIRDFTFNESTEKITFNAYSNIIDSLIVYADKNLATCHTKNVKIPQLKIKEFKIERFESKTERFYLDSKIVKLQAKKIDSITKELCQNQEDEIDCDNKDHTLIHEICWLSVEDYNYNVNIPNQAAIAENTGLTIAGITKEIQPIWRPNTSYLIQFELKDKVDNDSVGHSFYNNYGFTTGGPIGFFHKHPKATYSDIQLTQGEKLIKEDGSEFIASPGQIFEEVNGLIRNSDGTLVENVKITAKPDKYPLISLKQYIDYNRSYPNADGNLLGAKPLFFDDETTQIYLFFSKPYVTNFFRKWDAYNGKKAIDGRIKIVIKDPIEDISITNPPALDYDSTIENIPQTIEEWRSDENPQIPFALSQYASLYNANQCVGNAEIIKPASQFLHVTPKHLKPTKLYTAIVNCMYDYNENETLENTPLETAEVHKFVFKTSQYATFEKQILSYHSQKNIGEEIINREAIFSINLDLIDLQINGAFNTITGQSIVGFDSTVIANLTNNYQHPFDRIFEGIFGLKPLDEAISTEINLIKNTQTNKIVAILIRNPEPFNNPKFSLDVLRDTVQVLDLIPNPAHDAEIDFASETVNPAFRVLHSKDCSQVLIMHENLEIVENIHLLFKYKIWDGDKYVVPNINPVTHAIIDPNKPIGIVKIENVAILNHQ